MYFKLNQKFEVKLKRGKSLILNPGNLNTLFDKTANEYKITNCKKLGNSRVYKSELIGQIIGESREPIIQKRKLK